jgi:hypothetical protein
MRRTPIRLVGLVLSLLLVTAGAAQAQKITTDYNREANFSQYKTFMWIKEPTTHNPLVQQRIVEDVNAALEARGLRLVKSDADVGVAAHAATQKERTLNTFYDGFGGGWRWRWGGGFGTATTTVQTYEVGTLVVDVFDTHTKEAVWRGTSEKTLSSNPEKNAANLNKAIDKMFRNFPPSSAHTH